MIKINLLPPHVVEKRRVRSLAVLLLAMLLLEIGSFAFYYSTLVRTEKARKIQLTETTAKADEVENMQAQVAAEIAAAGKVSKNLTWHDNIYRHNAKIADSLAKINEYIFAKLTIQSLTLNGSAVSLRGSTKDLDHIASAYLNLLRSPYIKPPKGVTFVPALGGGSAQGPLQPTDPARTRRDTMAPPGSNLRQANLPNLAPSAASGNPNERVGVSFTFVLDQKYSIGSGSSSQGVPGATPNAGRARARADLEARPVRDAKKQ